MFLASSIILTLLSTVFCLKATKWGCPDINEDYGIPRNKDNNGPVWGDQVQPMRLSTSEFNKFHRKVDEIRKKVFDNFLLDDLQTVMRLYRDFEISPEMSISRFSITYVPKNFHRQDNLGLTIKVLEAIADDPTWKNVKKHSFIAGCDMNFPVQNSDFVARKIANRPLKEFKVERIVGIIKVHVNNKIGYLVIDTLNAVTPTPFVMLNVDKGGVALSLTEKFKSLDGRIAYTVTERSDKTVFIQALHYKVERGVDVLKSEEAILVSKPLCSFVQTQNQFVLSSPIRTVTKISPDGYKKASVAVTLYNKDKGTKIFSIGLETFDGNPQCTKFDSITGMTQRDQEIFDKTCDVMNIQGEKKLALKNDLKELENLSGFGDELRESDSEEETDYFSCGESDAEYFSANERV